MKVQRNRRRDMVAGCLIYACGDTLAALLTGDASLMRTLGMMLTGGLLYAWEIPTYFCWIDSKTTKAQGTGAHHQPSRHHQRVWQRIKASLMRGLLAMLYFNPLWIARHLAIIALISGHIEQLSPHIFSQALNSFLLAIPITLSANMVIQNLISLKYRFIASALFSSAMAIYYPLSARFF